MVGDRFSPVSRLLAAAVVVLSVLAGAARAEPTRLVLEQAHRQGGELVVVADIRDGADSALAEIASEGVSATLNGHPLSLNAVGRFDSVGERATYLFLVDISKSLKKDQFDALRKGLADWISAMDDDDRFGLIAFGESVQVLTELGSDRKGFLAALPTLTPTDNWTQLNLALLRGLEIGRRLDEDLPPRRMLVVISDGIEDSLGGASREELLLRFKEASIPVYALGYTALPLTDKKKEGLTHLGEMARSSGGDIVVVEGAKDFAQGYRKLRERIERSWVARFALKDVSFGEKARLELFLRSGTRLLSDATDLRPASVSALPSEVPPASPASEASAAASSEPAKRSSAFLLVIAGGLLLVVAFVLRRRRVTSVASKGEGERSDKPQVLTSRGRRLRLTVVRGAQPSRVFDLDVDEPVVVGRSPSRAGLVLEGDLGISGAHLKIFDRDGVLYVEDLHSTNGTFLNGVALDGAYRLKDGDLLLMGGTELRVFLPEKS